jgi:hypothetical protein
MEVLSEYTLVLESVFEKRLEEIKPMSFPKTRSVKGSCSRVILKGNGMNNIPSNAKKETAVLITVLFMQQVL